ncbi:MAG: helix-turn-helix domain-containing protein [Egibacteraceae bacterium]
MRPFRFATFRATAGLSIRAAAAHLGVAEPTIQRWESTGDQRSVIPAWVADQLRALIERHARDS